MKTTQKTITTSFNRFELPLPIDAIMDCAHSGSCDEDVVHWAPKIERPEEITAELLREELAEYGSWDDEELKNDSANWTRLVWIAAGNIKDAAGQVGDEEQVLALCAFLDCEPSDLSEEDYTHYGLTVYSMGKQEYAIGTDSEAQKAAEMDIRESAWAFNASFLADFTGLPEEAFTAMQAKCEDANDAVLRCIEKMDSFEHFAEEAISADGRGHFLSGYDGEENEEGNFFIYRIN